jgi:hypothetical protein
MEKLYVEMLAVMDAAFQDYSAALPKPVRVRQGRGWAYRFEDRDVHHAVVLKLALVQSTLRAALTLLRSGHVMEQAMLQRIVDEANEDILFLVYAVTNDTITPLHQRYLAAFWAEEFSDFDNPTSSHQSRDMVPRKKIRAYLARLEGKDLDASRAAQVTKVISKVYSGFVHGASPHIMEIYGGAPPHFHTRGMSGTPKITEYEQDLWNYMYRGLLSHIFAAKMFGSQKHVDALVKDKLRFESAMGKDYGSIKT